MGKAGSFLFALHVNMQAVAHTDRAEQPKFSLRGEKEELRGWLDINVIKSFKPLTKPQR